MLAPQPSSQPGRPRHPAYSWAQSWRLALPLLALGLVLALALITTNSDQGPRSERSYDEIAARVAGLSAPEILELLGEPDSRQSVYLRDRRWIWWNYTYLEGPDYPPEIRGQVVHLEITLRREDPASGSPWRAAEPYGVRYHRPGAVPASGPLQTRYGG